jgi:hypothetical protein
VSGARSVAERLSSSQRTYLLAVRASLEPYTARHGVTANWALRHNYTDTIVRLVDGREGPWDSFSVDDRVLTGIEEILGQRLTSFGARVAAAIVDRYREADETGTGSVPEGAGHD